MRYKPTVIVLVVLGLFLVSISATSVASAQAQNTYSTTNVIFGYTQITQPAQPIDVSGQLLSGSKYLAGMTIKVWEMRASSLSMSARARERAPQLVATVTTDAWGMWSVSFKAPTQGYYYVYATFDGATISQSSTRYSSSQSEMMVVKVTDRPESSILRKPTFIFVTATSQQILIGEQVSLWSQLRSFGKDIHDGDLVLGKTVLVFCSYKRPDSNNWSGPRLINTTVLDRGHFDVQFVPKQPGSYRFETYFSGDPTLRGGYDASTSNSVEIQVLNGNS